MPGIAHPSSPPPSSAPSADVALTIGNFDGVHLGHRALVQRCREHVGPHGRVIVLAFDPHPMTKLRPESAPARITPLDERATLLRDAGADEVVCLSPTDELLAKPAEGFVDWLVGTYRPSVIVEGSDFHFGKGRGGNTDLLALLGPSRGYRCIVEPAVDVTLTDHLIARASSSLLRWLLSNGRVRDAAIVTGRPHRLEATVVEGDRLGRSIGFPTANLVTASLPPGDGVYAGLAHIPAIKATLPAAINIGTRPTVKGLDRRIEAHLLRDGAPGDWSPLPGLPEYGWSMRLDLIARVRDQVRFPDLAGLRAQLARDITRVRTITTATLPAHAPITLTATATPAPTPTPTSTAV